MGSNQERKKIRKTISVIKKKKTRRCVCVTRKKQTLEKLQKGFLNPSIPFRCVSCPLFPSLLCMRDKFARSYKKAAIRAPKPRTPAEARVTRPAEESAEPVDSAAPEPEALLDSEFEFEVPDEEESSSLLLLEEEPLEEAVAAAPVSVPVPVTMVAPEAAPMTTVVELPTETSKEVRLREMFCMMWVTPSGRPAGMVATSGCEVTAGGRADWAVSTAGMPVTTPRELVCVR